MNNYQEALEVISEFIGSYDNNTMLDVAMNYLQRLIDIHDIDYVVIEKQSQDLQKLEKALDIACEWITDNDGWINIFGNDDWRSRFPNGVNTKEEWKEYLIIESEK